MNIKELHSKKTPIVTIDKSLEKFKKQPLFQEKVDKANDTLRKAGLAETKKTTAKQLHLCYARRQ